MTNIFEALKDVWFYVPRDSRGYIFSLESKSKLTGPEKAKLTQILHDAQNKKDPTYNNDFWDEYL
jgi:hypothetical protein